jgi:hypothetical protein
MSELKWVCERAPHFQRGSFSCVARVRHYGALASGRVTHYMQDYRVSPKRKHTDTMRIILLASALIVGSSLFIPAHAAVISARETARSECARFADAQNFGERYVQRRNFIQECLIDRGFNAQ